MASTFRSKREMRGGAPAFEGHCGRTGTCHRVHSTILIHKVRGVDPDKVLLILRNFLEGKDRGGGADRHTRPAIDAFVRVHVEMRSGLVVRLVGSRMNAINRAGFDAVIILCAGIDDRVGHNAEGESKYNANPAVV